MAIPNLKAAQLKRLAFLCGLPTTGTKSQLTDRIVDASRARTGYRAGVQSSASPRILSIDMGIRNMAFSLLTSVPSALEATSTPRTPPRIHLHAWSTHDFLAAGTQPPLPDPRYTGSLPDPFAPLILAHTAARFVRDTLLPLQPTHVLIERQRFRTGGAAPVQEWTLRVNSLEAMLHAVFRTLQEYKTWAGEVVSIPPSRVGPFWLESDQPTVRELGSGRNASRETLKKESAAAKKLNLKREKANLLGTWLENGHTILPTEGNGATCTVKLFRQRLQRPRRVRKAKAGEENNDVELTKIDDLSDSLLQGMAWLKWEENKLQLGSREGMMRLLGEEA
jgi:cruciform cutting endonuclease 1